VRDVDDPCNNDMYPNYPIVYLSVLNGYIIETILFLILCVDNFCLAFAQGRDFVKGLARNRVILLVVMGIDLVISFCTPSYALRAAPYLRILLVVCYSHATRSRLDLVMKTVPAVANVFLLALIYVAFFAWLGVIFFPKDTEEGKQYFRSLGEGMWSLLILLTTANYPDVMMPAYKEHRESFLFFFLFVSLGVFFLVNMLTAVTFNVYQQTQEKKLEMLRNHREDSVRAAFRLLSENGHITLEVLRALFTELNHYHDISYIDASDAEALISSLDSDRNGEISQEEFDSIMEVLTREYRRGPNKPMIERRCPAVAASSCWQTLKGVVQHRCFDIVMDLFLVVTLILSIAETWPEIVGSGVDPKTAQVDNNWDHIEHLFVFIFLTEAILRIAVEGFSRYWEHPKNKFDFSVTITTGVVTLYVFLPNAYNNPELIRAVAAIRALRVLRLIRVVPGCKVVVHTFVRTLPDAFAICKVLFCAMYLFSVLGLQIFGGVITTDPNSPYAAKLADSDFGKAGYYANNFNDMPSGMVTLFELLVVNNWFVICCGYTAACGYTARIFFIAFYIFGVVICLNIVVAFILDSFMSELNTALERRRLEDSLRDEDLAGE